MNNLQILVTTTDKRLLRSVVSLLEIEVAVRTAENGIECVRKLREQTPDLLVLIPPVLWGTETGVLAVMEEEPSLSRVPILLFPDPMKPGTSVARYNPRGSASDQHLARIVARLCRCYHEHYTRSQLAPPLQRMVIDAAQRPC